MNKRSNSCYEKSIKKKKNTTFNPQKTNKNRIRILQHKQRNNRIRRVTIHKQPLTNRALRLLYLPQQAAHNKLYAQTSSY